MCSKPKIPTVVEEPSEVIKTATKADASIQKANSVNRGDVRGTISDNIKTSNTGLDDEVVSSKKKLLGE